MGRNSPGVVEMAVTRPSKGGREGFVCVWVEDRVVSSVGLCTRQRVGIWYFDSTSGTEDSQEKPLSQFGV